MLHTVWTPTSLTPILLTTTLTILYPGPSNPFIFWKHARRLLKTLLVGSKTNWASSENSLGGAYHKSTCRKRRQQLNLSKEHANICWPLIDVGKYFLDWSQPVSVAGIFNLDAFFEHREAFGFALSPINLEETEEKYTANHFHNHWHPFNQALRTLGYDKDVITVHVCKLRCGVKVGIVINVPCKHRPMRWPKGTIGISLHMQN